ncbi:MAG: hypothetical protein ACU85E_12840 [Gammaproteobacteria bacterium]
MIITMMGRDIQARSVVTAAMLSSRRTPAIMTDPDIGNPAIVSMFRLSMTIQDRQATGVSMAIKTYRIGIDSNKLIMAFIEIETIVPVPEIEWIMDAREIGRSGKNGNKLCSIGAMTIIPRAISEDIAKRRAILGILTTIAIKTETFGAIIPGKTIPVPWIIRIRGDQEMRRNGIGEETTKLTGSRPGFAMV